MDCMVFVGKGQSGSVFKPHFPCKTLTLHGEYVSKVFMWKSIRDEEWNETQKVLSLDPENKFSLKCVKKCNIKNNKETLSHFPTKNILYTIVMEYGGPDLNRVKSINFSVVALLEIVSGVQLLSQQHISHFDIKPDNILVNSLGIFKLIDFGECIYFSDYRNVYSNTMIDEDHPFYAPEICVLSQTKKNQKRFRLENREFLTKYKRTDDKIFAEKFDVYALGKTFETVFMKFVFKTKADERFFKTLLSHMVHTNPYKRFSINQSVDFIETYLNLI